MIKYEKNGKYGIKIEQVPLEKLNETDNKEGESHICILFWAKQNKDISSQNRHHNDNHKHIWKTVHDINKSHD